MYITENPDVPCKLRDPEIWHARADSKRTKLAKALCHMCPERVQCLTSTIKFEEREGYIQPSTFGGLSWVDRTRLAQRKKQRAETVSA